MLLIGLCLPLLGLVVYVVNASGWANASLLLILTVCLFFWPLIALVSSRKVIVDNEKLQIKYRKGKDKVFMFRDCLGYFSYTTDRQMTKFFWSHPKGIILFFKDRPSLKIQCNNLSDQQIKLGILLKRLKTMGIKKYSPGQDDYYHLIPGLVYNPNPRKVAEKYFTGNY